jgi:CRISPR/Cas system CMR-associated protein Cmr5 small subunit
MDPASGRPVVTGPNGTGRGVARVDQHMARAAAAMLPDTIEKELRTRYRQLPVMVRTAGLAATYAYLVGKSDPSTSLGRAYRDLATGIRLYLTRPGTGGQATTNPQMLAALGQMAAADYARAGREVELLAVWCARLADAAWQAAQ